MSKSPIAGSKVTIGPTSSLGKDQGIATTSTNGAFLIKPIRRFGIYIVPGDVFPIRYDLSVQQFGFMPFSTELYHRALGEGSMIAVPEIRLEPASH